MGVLMRNGIVEGIYTDRKYPSIKIGDKFFSANLDYGKPVVDLRKFQEGDEVEFDVTKNGDYENIIEIKKMGDEDTSFNHGANVTQSTSVRSEPTRTNNVDGMIFELGEIVTKLNKYDWYNRLGDDAQQKHATTIFLSARK